nr:hypothetical protein Iba_chr14cCG8760 [Ipomoea batatas]GMD91022.1 hypothetical protein Iba_chr14dCG15360 [Ipomoea batatas]GME16196.1 hypothetical protein Iba_scaffold17162CG0020 [Ipomoea batatas]
MFTNGKLVLYLSFTGICTGISQSRNQELYLQSTTWSIMESAAKSNSASVALMDLCMQLKTRQLMNAQSDTILRG